MGIVFLSFLFTDVNFYANIVNPLNANPEKLSNTLKQIVGNLSTICLSVFDHFMNLALKVLMQFVVSNFICFLFENITKVNDKTLLYFDFLQIFYGLAMK